MVNRIIQNYRVVLLLFIGFSLLPMLYQNSVAATRYGDGIAFPHSCADFSGLWTNESMDKFIQIEQQQCKSATITFFQESGFIFTSIEVLLDGKIRTVHNHKNEYQTITCSWNSLEHGLSIEVLLRHHFMGQNNIIILHGTSLSYEEDGRISVTMRKEVQLDDETMYREEKRRDLFYRVEEGE